MATQLASGYIELTVRPAGRCARSSMTSPASSGQPSGWGSGPVVTSARASRTKPVRTGRTVANSIERALSRTVGARIGRQFGAALDRSIRKETKLTGKKIAEDFAGGEGIAKAAKNLTLFGAAAGVALAAVGSLGPAVVVLTGGILALGAAAGGAAVAGRWLLR